LKIAFFIPVALTCNSHYFCFSAAIAPKCKQLELARLSSFFFDAGKGYFGSLAVLSAITPTQSMVTDEVTGRKGIGCGAPLRGYVAQTL
jgi:hypothetical protein